MAADEPIHVLVAGMGGASLGTEIIKSLRLAGGYRIFGCDIAPEAYGHYEAGMAGTYLADRDDYVSSILSICRETHTRWIVPGGEKPLALLNEARGKLVAEERVLVANSSDVIALASDKARTFAALSELGFRIPATRTVDSLEELRDFPFPCVVKPAKDSGGSADVFLAENLSDASMYADHLLANDRTPLLQEYIPIDQGGEFTIGVLSTSSGDVLCSVALERLFQSKLSVRSSSSAGLISSGYSQGRIDEFPSFRHTAEEMAKAIGSTGPLNVQGRIAAGTLVPFEINARFSASTHLRALAGVNEVDLFIRQLEHGEVHRPGPARSGYYLRSFTERFVAFDDIKR